MASRSAASTTPYVILGAGVAGLAAARALQHAGCTCVVLERCPSIGGLTRTIRIGDFCFDYTGHLLHLAQHASPSAIPYANLSDADWQTVSRQSFCYIGGRLVAAPIQYHLGQLEPALLSECAASYEARPALPRSGEASFRDFVVSGFGRRLADLFLIPQNEKTLATPLERLSLQGVKRFFPPPDESLVRVGMSPHHTSPPEYNSRFWYPKLGGIELLVRGLAAGLGNIHTLNEAVAIDLESRTVRTRAGNEWRWGVLLSSVPLRVFCERTNDNELREAAAELTHSSTIVFNVGLRGPLAPPLAEAHWIYVPDRDLPFYRVGFYSNMSRGMCPADCAALYVEVAAPGGQAGRMDIAGELQPRVLHALSDLGWVKPEAITALSVNIIECAYVHHTPAREQAVKTIRQRLRNHGVHLIGRYGLWDYISMEDAMLSGIHAAEEVA